MAVADTHSTDDHHDDHHHHDHGEFIAHHFDGGAEQQFDSGKLGIWLFLVTEVLFFSGLFVAYVLYRSLHPEIFEQAHVFLDKWLGGLNTVVLLFSSLTMAWAVRCSQLERNKAVSFFVLITMICAAMFLGVKAIEYSHKWDMGILVRSAFDFHEGHPEPQTAIGQSLHISDYLVYLSVIPTILLVGFAVASVAFKVMGNQHQYAFWGCMAITVGGYFLGVVGGHIYMDVTDGGVGGHAQNAPVVLYAQEAEQDDGPVTAPDGTVPHESPEPPAAEEGDDAEAGDEDEGHEDDGHSHEEGDAHSHAGDESHAEGDHAHDESHVHHGPDPTKFHRDVGVFFSIYYCMTGLHAIHIIAGIIALAWILWRSLLGHWRKDYFGPVEYVGLYWHLVDLIWIFLFPMLYLID
ncbi:MAG: cytochrome c oxidase subunit 3 [Planctomycetota bacterium]